MQLSSLKLMICSVFLVACGNNISESEPKISGGIDVADPADPAIQSTVSIMQRTHQGHWLHQCSGTVIDAYHVISAAHCFMESSLDFTIGSGSDPREGQHYKVMEFLMPKAYWGDRPFGDNESFDLAVFTVDKPLTPQLQAVAISSDKSIPHDARFLLAGYGFDSPEEKNLDFPSLGKLRKIDTGISLFTGHPEAIKYKFELKTNGSAGSQTQGGDSGGPAYRVVESGLQLQGSLSSGGHMGSTLYSQYTNLAYFHRWLKCASQDTQHPISGLNPDPNDAEQYPCQPQDKFLPIEQLKQFQQERCQRFPGFALHFEPALKLPDGDSLAATSCDPTTRQACQSLGAPFTWDESAQRCVR